MAPTQAQLDAARVVLGRVMNSSADRLGYLWSRWQDEKEYENFGDYEAEMKKLASAHPEIEFIRAGKRPFGFTARYRELSVNIVFSVTGSGVKYKAVR